MLGELQSIAIGTINRGPGLFRQPVGQPVMIDMAVAYHHMVQTGKIEMVAKIHPGIIGRGTSIEED